MTDTIKVLITGKGGQLATELIKVFPNKFDVVALSSHELDIVDAESVERSIAAVKPAIVINAAAYTAVDKAEDNQQRAFDVNYLGSEHLAHACKVAGCSLIHVSTDFVFDGKKAMPYLVDDAPNPINVYGASKLRGERAITNVLEDAVVIRTAWVYSCSGNNFVKTMLSLMQNKPELSVICDQIGTPTWANGLAQFIWQIASKYGESERQSLVAKPTTYHWTDAGIASWYDFAVAIRDLGIEKGILKQATLINPITANQYPLPAKRPSYSVLDKTETERLTGFKTIHWRQQLDCMLDEYTEQ
nr:dTDP-4-dehydrorhamnose reductase [Shewanella sp. WXL01]